MSSDQHACRFQYNLRQRHIEQRQHWHIGLIFTTRACTSGALHLHVRLLRGNVLAQKGRLLDATLQRRGSQQMRQRGARLVHAFQRHRLLADRVLDVILGQTPAAIGEHLVRLLVAAERMPPLAGLGVPMAGQHNVECVLAMQRLRARRQEAVRGLLEQQGRPQIRVLAGHADQLLGCFAVQARLAQTLDAQHRGARRKLRQPAVVQIRDNRLLHVVVRFARRGARHKGGQSGHFQSACVELPRRVRGEIPFGLVVVLERLLVVAEHEIQIAQLARLQLGRIRRVDNGVRLADGAGRTRTGGQCSRSGNRLVGDEPALRHAQQRASLLVGDRFVQADDQSLNVRNQRTDRVVLDKVFQVVQIAGAQILAARFVAVTARRVRFGPDIRIEVLLIWVGEALAARRHVRVLHKEMKKCVSIEAYQTNVECDITLTIASMAFSCTGLSG